MRSPRTIGLVLLGLVLLPIAAYVTYEVRSLSANEELMAEIYERQLESMLFSINQHAWNVTDGWANDLNRTLATSSEPPEEAVRRFLDTHSATLQAIMLTDSLLTDLRVVQRTIGAALPELRPQLTGQRLQRLIQRKRAGYRQFEPLLLAADDSDEATRIALLFVPDDLQPTLHVAGIVFDARSFVQDVLAPKLQDVAREQFVLGIFRPGVADPLYSTEPFPLAEVRQQRSVWLFPDYVLGIRPRGATLEEVLQDRFRQNLLLVVLVALVLLAGVGVVYRSIRQELTLARMKSDFVSNVSHELRTPLALIRMFAETLELGRVPSEDKRMEYYRIISQETERLTRLVTNILNFSRIEAGKKTYTLEPLLLNDVVNDVLALYDFTLENHGFTTEVHCAEALPPILGDREALCEALINLIDNAMKYSEADKYLRVTTGADDGAVILDVADHGIGISPEDQEKIFDTFYRVSSGLVHNTKGTGLGLALVKHIVDAHGGRIDVHSRPGEGSRFRLRFPVSMPSLPVETAASAMTS